MGVLNVQKGNTKTNWRGARGIAFFTTGPRGEVRQKLLTTVRDVVKLCSSSLSSTAI